jgi:hypothetical protein
MIAIGDVVGVASEGSDDISDGRERLIDALSFLQNLSRGS